MPRASTTPTIYRRTSRPPKRQRLHQSARTLISLRQFIRVPFRLVGKVRKPLGELVATRQDQPTSLQVQKNQLLFLDRFEPPLSAHNPPRAVSNRICSLKLLSTTRPPPSCGVMSLGANFVPLGELWKAKCSALPRDQLASRQVVAGSSRSSAPSCNRTGSRSPSIAMRNTERASSSGFTVLLPTDLSVSHASSKAVSKTTKVCGSKELLWKPRIAPPSDFILA